MVIKRLKGAKFGTDRIARVVTGYALYEEGNANPIEVREYIEKELKDRLAMVL